MEESWAQTEMAGAQVWDQRCRKRLVRICESIIARPEESFSAACGPGLRQAGSRIFAQEQMTVAGLLAGHVEQTAHRCQEHRVMVVAQDTTELDYSTHKATEGLGPLSTTPKSRGLLMHTALAVSEGGVPLGLLGQELWAREPQEFGRAASGPGIEFLEYLAPRDGRPLPPETRANDIMHWQTKLFTKDAALAAHRVRTEKFPFVSPGVVDIPGATLGFTKAILVRDPDGHSMQLTEK